MYHVIAALLCTASDPPTSIWDELDREIRALEARLGEQHSGPEVDGWIRARFAYSNDVDASPAPGDQDLGGFNLDNARLRITGAASSDYTYTLSVEGGDPAVSDASGTGLALLDAYVGVKLDDWGSLSVGRFSATFLWNAGVEERRLLFLDRSFLDEVWDGRDVGAELFVQSGAFCGWAAAQNGADGAGNDFALSARASLNLLGDALYGREGAEALEPGEEHLTIGAAWYDDTSFDDGTAIGGDVVFAMSRWSAVAEIVNFDEDLRPAPAENTATGVLIPSGSAATGTDTPWGLSVGYLLVPRAWEVGVRWQDLDDDASTTAIAGVVNRYIAGQDLKWTLEVDSSDSDDPALEATTLAVGLTVSF